MARKSSKTPALTPHEMRLRNTDRKLRRIDFRFRAVRALSEPELGDLVVRDSPRPVPVRDHEALIVD